jgi:hypothetical protein
MINRIFIIEERLPSDWTYRVGENIFFSFLIPSPVKENLKKVNAVIEDSGMEDHTLTIAIHQLPDRETLESITSFLFRPGYFRVGDQPVINLTGPSVQMLAEAATSISRYLSTQGFEAAVLNYLEQASGEPVLAYTPSSAGGRMHRLINSPAELARYYQQLLLEGNVNSNDIFFRPESEVELQPALLNLQKAEDDLREHHAGLYASILRNAALEKELNLLKIKYEYTRAELNNQKQFIEVLRSDHATKELQDYYHYEYEILPLWYKRLGHVIKVIMGKRSFRSLFRDDVKKYKD